MNTIELKKTERKVCNHSIKITKTAERKVMLICKQTGRKFNDVINELLEQSTFRVIEPRKSLLERLKAALDAKLCKQKRFSDAGKRQKSTENRPPETVKELEN